MVAYGDNYNPMKTVKSYSRIKRLYYIRKSNEITEFKNVVSYTKFCEGKNVKSMLCIIIKITNKNSPLSPLNKGRSQRTFPQLLYSKDLWNFINLYIGEI
jgi:hypothetical protein